MHRAHRRPNGTSIEGRRDTMSPLPAAAPAATFPVSVPVSASVIASLQRAAGNRAVEGLLSRARPTGRRPAGPGWPVVQRQILIGASDDIGEPPLQLTRQTALELLIDHHPEVFGGDVLLETSSLYLAILQTMETEHRRFASIGELAAAVERERRSQLRKVPAAAEPAAIPGGVGPSTDHRSTDHRSSGGPPPDSAESAQSPESVEQAEEAESSAPPTRDYDRHAEREYRLSMAHGRAWGSEAEAAVVAESLGVRFRIYHFAEGAVTPTYHVDVGVAGPLFALHFDPTPGHYSLLEPDPRGRFLLHGNRYRLVEVAQDGHCLFVAAFRAANGRTPSAEDVRGLRAIAASMVPADVIAHMLARVEPGQAAESRLSKVEGAAAPGAASQGKRKRDEKGKDLAPFMSRINYLLNRYPNLFYLLRAQHSDFGQLFGSFSETRLALFYNDALMPKRPVGAVEREAARLGPDDLRLPALPEPADDVEAADQLELVLDQARDVVARLRMELQSAPTLYEPLTPEEMGEWEEAIRDGMEHHTSRDEFALDPRSRTTTLEESSTSSGPVAADRRTASARQAEAIATPLPSDDLDAAKAFREEYIYSSNAPDKHDFYRPERREQQVDEMRDQRKDAALAPLRKGALKLQANEDHSEQLMLAGGPWDAVTTIALETAWEEATRAADPAADPRPDPAAVRSPHTFTVVINRAACPACTDTLIAAIRLFWRTCERLFGLAAGRGRETLGQIFLFELSVTGMYTASNADSTTANDLAALTLSGWTIGLHHDKSGGLASQGYALVEALYGEHERGEVDAMAGRGQTSVKPINATGKLELGHARKFKEAKLTYRGPDRRETDRAELNSLLKGKSSARSMLTTAKEYLGRAAAELGNYPALDSDAFASSAAALLEARYVAAQDYGNRDSKALRKHLVGSLAALYDHLDQQRLDKQ